ncbi:MAG: pirin family protein [Oligoflexales bacterium]|nr:pirin family protein [Oligoflexales bacterium]
MITIRKSEDRGHFDHDWLKTYHTFSFSAYRDEAYMGFRTLRVINEDIVLPKQGFGRHSHQDMEIITYPISGELTHQDSMGNGSTVSSGEIQYMSAGTGVKHSEFNHSDKELHLLQIWILPDRRGYTPSYHQQKISEDEKKNRLHLMVSSTGESGSISIHQDVKIFASTLEPEMKIDYKPEQARHIWLQIIRGSLIVNSFSLEAGDGAAVSDESHLDMLGGKSGVEFLLFDLS